MHLESLELANFRCFEKSSFSFHPLLTVIVGDNAAGKTALLNAAALAAGVFLNSFDKGHGFSPFDIRTVSMPAGSTVHREMKFPASIRAAGSVGDREISWELSVNRAEGIAEKRVRTRYSAAKMMTDLSKEYNSRIQEGDEDLILPLIAYYSAGRVWHQHRNKKDDVFKTANRRNGYLDALDSAATEKQMMQWFKKSRLKELEKQKEIPEFRAILTAVMEAYSELSEKEVTGISYNFDYDSIEIAGIDNGAVFVDPSDQWSAGYKSLLTLIADIGYRMANLNPGLEDRVLEETDGIALIDEIDLHLHPRWQQSVLPLLRKIFPKVQFIVTTHAPGVIQSVDSENLLILSDMKGMSPAEQTYGKDVNSILTSVMKADTRPKEILKLFQEYYRYLDEEQLDEAQQKLDQLKDRIGNDPQISEEQTGLALEKMWRSDDLD